MTFIDSFHSLYHTTSFPPLAKLPKAQELRNTQLSDSFKTSPTAPTLVKQPAAGTVQFSDHNMPLSDMPYRHKRAAPKFDTANPCSIQSYFEDLDVLFIRHQVLDSSEKKHTAVRYTDIETEHLWKSALSFSDPACSYEDFTAEIIGMYPKASAEHQYTIPRLQRLVSDQARTLIQSEKELTNYYHQSHIISYNLITMHCIGVLEQAHHFLAGFEPSLASDICSRLEAKLPDHFPSDPYKIEDVFQAALYTLRIQACVPPIPLLRNILLPLTRPLDAATSSQIPLQAAPTFPTTPEHPSSV